MSDAAQILVVILSVFLALFLLLAIVLTVLLIRVTRQIHAVAESAQATVTTVGKLVEGAAKLSSPALVAKMVFGAIKRMKK